MLKVHLIMEDHLLNSTARSIQMEFHDYEYLMKEYNITEDPVTLKNTILASQIWGSMIAIFGILGNAISISSIIYQLRKNCVAHRMANSSPNTSQVSQDSSGSPSTNSTTASPNSVSQLLTFHKNAGHVEFSNKCPSTLESSGKNDRHWFWRDFAFSKHFGGRFGFKLLIRGGFRVPRFVNRRKEAIPAFAVKAKRDFKCSGDIILILFLSMTDFTYCLLNLPLTIYIYALFLQGEKPEGLLCSTAAYLRYSVAYAEFLILGLLAVERCVDLRKNPSTKFFTVRRTTLIVSVMWILSFLIHVYPLLTDKFGYDAATLKCDMLSERKDGEGLDYRFFAYVLQTTLPNIMVPSGCISIFFQIWRSQKQLSKTGLSKEALSKSYKEMWVFTSMTLALLIMYFICVIPMLAYSTLNNFCMNVPLYVGIMLFMFYWIQYSLNFIIYNLYNKNYRAACKEFLNHAFLSRCNKDGSLA